MPHRRAALPRSSSPLTAPLAVALDAERGLDATSSARDEVLVLFDACAPAVRRYVSSCGVAPDVADDVVQETFVALFQHLRKGGDRQNLRGWLMKVGYRLALKQRRGARRRARWQGPWSVDAIGVPDTTPGPEAACAAREDHRRVRAVLKALPERDRQCLYLRAEGLRYRDIAGVLGISLGAVAKSLARAIGRVTAVVHS
jgi:RNA polymerase sigma-70 factor, ECF subfamily